MAQYIDTNPSSNTVGRVVTSNVKPSNPGMVSFNQGGTPGQQGGVKGTFDNNIFTPYNAPEPSKSGSIDQTTGKFTPFTAPTVISDETTRGTTIPSIIDKANQLTNNNQPITDANGNTIAQWDSSTNSYKASGNAVNSGSNIQNEIDSYDAIKGALGIQDTTDETDPTMQLLKSMQSTNDQSYADQITATQQQYKSLMDNLQEAQRSTTGQLTSALGANGARYAVNSAAMGMQAKLTNDVKALASLNSQEVMDIAKLKSAQADKNFELMGKMIDQINSRRAEKTALADKIYANITEANKEAQAQVQKNADNLQAAKKEAYQQLQKSNAPKSAYDAVAKATTQDDVWGSIAGYAPANGEIVDINGSKAFVDKNTGKIIRWIGGGENTGGTTTTGIMDTSSPDYMYKDFLTGRTAQQADYFNSLPDSDKSIVSQLVSGDMLLSDAVKTRGAQGTKDIQKYVQMAQKIDPTYSVNNEKIRYDFKKAWMTDNVKGSIGSQQAINTALGHLATLKELSDKLPGKSLNFLNSAENILNKETGDPAVINFRIALKALGSELARVYTGGVPAESQIKEWESNLAANFAKDQFQGASNITAELLSSKLTSMRYKYKSTMGKEYSQSLIDPDKKEALIEAGIDPEMIAKEDVPGSDNTVSNQIETARNSINPETGQKYTDMEIIRYLRQDPAYKEKIDQAFQIPELQASDIINFLLQ